MASVNGLLAVLVVALAAARLFGNNWYGIHKPIGMGLLEGLPSSWEAVYFLAHPPTFLGDAAPQLGIAPVAYRTYVNLYLFSQLYGWIGGTYWALAAVDVFFWVTGSICTYHLARRLGASDSGAAASAVLMAGSPLLVAFMWRQDLHLANVASLPPGLWAAAALVQDDRSWLRVTAGLSFLLLYLSTSYQYQWIVAPAALILAAFQPGLGPRRGLVVVAGAVALFLVLTAVLLAVFAIAGLGPQESRLGAVNQPGAPTTGRLAEATTLRALLTILPGPQNIATMVGAYQPVVFCAGLVGLALVGKRAIGLGILAVIVPLGFTTSYPTPWVAMTGYPIFYLGAGVACARSGALTVTVLRRHAVRPRVATALGLSTVSELTVRLFLLTNVDLFGNPSFVLSWWNVYSPAQIH